MWYKMPGYCTNPDVPDTIKTLSGQGDCIDFPAATGRLDNTLR